MRWLAPGADASAILTHQPTECLGAAHGPDEAYAVELGRAAFRSPLLLGGQAARAGVSCETCHRNGRSNPDFHFPGVSGAPGTADVTTSVLSSHRGDGIDNPKPIPDLSGPRSALKVSQDPADRKLEAFIHGIVTQEFDGAEPPAAVLAGVAAYVRALRPEACPARALEVVSPLAALHDARRAVRAAQAALARGDGPAAQVMIEAARGRLGDLNERYAAPGLAPIRADLVAASRDLAVAREEIAAGRPQAAAHRSAWVDRMPAWESRLVAMVRASLYDPHRLAQAAKASDPRGDHP